MKLKQLFITAFAILMSVSSFSQKRGGDYILKEGQDTLWCNITDIWRIGGQVNSISYLDKSGASKAIDKKEAKSIKSFRIDSYTFDYIPMKSAKPDSYKRHELKRLDGAIKYYDFKNVEIFTNSETKTKSISIGGVPTVHYSIILDNGKHYDISGGNLKNVIQPYFSKNSEFKKAFPHIITASNIMDAIRIYNNIKSGAKSIKPLNYKVYKEYSDYQAKKPTAIYDEFLGTDNSPMKIAFQKNESKKKYSFGLKSNWGYSIGKFDYRFNNASYIFGPAFRIIDTGKIILYQRGQDRFYREKEGFFVSSEDVESFYISDNLTSKIVPLYNPNSTKNTMMITVGSGANKNLQPLMQKHPKLFKQLGTLDKKDPDLYFKVKQIIIEYNK